MIQYEFWFAVGSQQLYGEACLEEVKIHAQEMVAWWNASGQFPFPVVWKPTLLDAGSILQFFQQANQDPSCAGVITWMHTFSPAKAWIAGLKQYHKPLCHFHTQFNEAIPYETIDMDFMNINQSAHGDREFAHLLTRMGRARKIVAGFWKNKEALQQVADWMRTAIGVVESKHLRIVRVGDNMRNVAVTEGDKVEAQLRFGWEIDAYNITDVEDYVKSVSKSDIDALLEEYQEQYDCFLGNYSEEMVRKQVAGQAAIEIALERFLKEKGYHAIVTNFEMLAGLTQLPGLAIQRLMEKGYGFGAEGDWKTAGLVRLMKQMTRGIKQAGGTSFMEDYTYHLVPGEEGILQSHMLEVCPSIAANKPTIRVAPLTMGNREDPARLVFTAKEGDGIAVSLIDLGERFRLLIQKVRCMAQPKAMPHLPVATAFWKPQPDFQTGVAAWLLAGGAHHTAFSYDLCAEQMEDFAQAIGIEAIVIDETTKLSQLKKELCWNASFFRK